MEPLTTNITLEYADKEIPIREPLRLEEIWGMIPTHTTRPGATDRPVKLSEQLRIYTDSLTTPTVRELWIYSTSLNDWLYVALST